MVDPNAPAPTQGRPADVYAEAMRELAAAISTLATAIRESAPFDVEWTPCEDIVDAGERDDARSSADPSPAVEDAEEQARELRVKVIPMIPTQRRGEPGSGSLCRPGGCGCAEPDDGQGRHARRDAVADEVPEQPRCADAAGCAEAGAR